MVNKILLDDFILKVGSGRILESNIPAKNIAELESKLTISSFNVVNSRFAMIPEGFKSTGMVRLPFGDSYFKGYISKYVLDHVGDRSYYLQEILRVIDGPIFMTEPSIESFPKDFLFEADNVYVYSTSVNGSVHEVNATFNELFSRSDLRRYFKNPGSSINKFNMLVPEDIKIEVGILFEKDKTV
jgi:hypothetical protein